MTAASADLYIEQGATFIQSFIYMDSNNIPIDLTGYTARMQARPTKEYPTPVIDATTTNGKITIVAAEGKITITLTATETSSYTFLKGVYDLEIQSASGIVTRLVQGEVICDPEVTR